jgi:hypothetical protein
MKIGEYGVVQYVGSGVLLCMCESEASFLHVQCVLYKSSLLSLHKTASPTRWREPRSAELTYRPANLYIGWNRVNPV